MKAPFKAHKSLSEKVNRILNTILVILILISVRLWNLASIEHEEKIEAAQGPQRRTIYERAERATIVDRAGIPLATNQIQYNAAIVYRDIAQLPRWIWRRDENNKRYKLFVRKEHITKLALFLGEMLDLDPIFIEDIIHAKAAILGDVPCVIKENITEEQYFRLKILEAQFPGIYAEHVAKRCYPQGRLASEVIGYLGAISQEKYQTITRELHELHEIIRLYEEDGPSSGFLNSGSLKGAKQRVKELEDQAYQITDLVGKAGIEASYDEKLRGTRGKRTYLTDRYGHLLRELEEGIQPLPGSQLRLTLSAELQRYAEELLAGYEERELIPTLEKNVASHFPWMKGGAIVVMRPDTGEILTLASYPRFDPNDFIKNREEKDEGLQQARRMQWLENENYLAAIWDQEFPLQRERFNPSTGAFYEETKILTWSEFLHFIAYENSPLIENFSHFNTCADAFKVGMVVHKILSLFASDEIVVSADKVFNTLFEGNCHKEIPVRLTLSEEAFLQKCKEEHSELLAPLIKELSPYFYRLPYNGDKLLYTDLCRLLISEQHCTDPLIKKVGGLTLETARSREVAKGKVERALHGIIASIFEETIFKTWRTDHFAEFLVEKRNSEKKARLWARPYLTYLQAEKQRQFSLFWEENKEQLLRIFLLGEGGEGEPYHETLLLWAKELGAGAHTALPWSSAYHELREALLSLDPSLHNSYLATMRSFKELNAPLWGQYSYLHGQGVRLQKDLAAAFYPKHGYGYMRSHAFRQATTAGSVFKVVCSYEILKQRYLKLQGKNANLGNLNPLTIIDDKHRSAKSVGKWNVGYTVEGQPIPLYYKGGRLPRSEHSGIGKVDLLRALETSSNPYFSIVAGTLLEDPEDLCQAAHLFGYGMKSGIDLPGEYGGHLPTDVSYNRTGIYSFAIGQHSLSVTPLQTSVMLASLVNGGKIVTPYVLQKEKESESRWHIFMPEEIRTLLITGLKRVVWGESGTARGLQNQFPSSLVQNIIGKTSTAEEMEKVRFDGPQTVQKVQHISFGTIFYDPDFPPLTKPELVIVVYLRHGRYGRMAAPLAAKIAQKWLEIRK